MAVKENAPVTEVVEEKSEDLNLENTPGFHVLQDGTFLGTYQTREDAQSFIDGHVAPQNLEAEIVEGSAAE